MTLRLYISLMMLMMVHSIMAQGSMSDRMAIPFFRNYTSQAYNAHNRNFGIECDSTGCVFVANFEGLLVYDGAEWETIHTSGISRITCIYKDSKGTIWFGGYNVLGYVTREDNLSVHYIIDGTNKKTQYGEITRIRENGKVLLFITDADKVYVVKDGKVKHSPAATLFNELSGSHRDAGVADMIKFDKVDLRVLATNRGIQIQTLAGEAICTLNEDNGLCSSTINDIAYDGKGNVWGATDNGIFVLHLSPVYSHFNENNGLRGQVYTIITADEHLYVGTLQGLFYLDDEQEFVRVSSIDHACWQLVGTPDGKVLAATADGVYLCTKSQAQQLTSAHTLSIIAVDDNTYVEGRVDGIYRLSRGGDEKLISKIPNVVKLETDATGGMWAMTLNNETYCMKRGTDTFKLARNGHLTLLLNYKDSQGRVWTSREDGHGLKVTNSSDMDKWLLPLADYNIQTVYVSGDAAWLGGNFGLIRVDVTNTRRFKTFVPQVYIRRYTNEDNTVAVTIANDKQDPLGQTQYCYRFGDKDKWSKWSDAQVLRFTNLEHGDYDLQVMSRDAFGNTSLSRTISFTVPTPIYLRWYAWLLYIAISGGLSFAFYRYRLRRYEAEQRHLEAIVEERTHALKDAQNLLLRQEREATVGKLTKGLIDRILNPMNYINNFSHLSIGLTKDIDGNVDDIKDLVDDAVKDNENVDIDNDELDDLFDDSKDVISMMRGNLEKIEQHGLSTTRILKAMEEMLKDRSGNMQPVDMCAIMHQAYEMLLNYFKDDIAKYGIAVEWQRPEAAISTNGMADQLSKTITNILGNAVYAVKKKAEKHIADYQPCISLALATDGDSIKITIQDNGIGIEDTIIDKIFDPFFTTKPTGEAPGVGLYLCQQIVQDHNGNISVQSTKDVGTEFTITISKTV